jgi:hypothetical protein
LAPVLEASNEKRISKLDFVRRRRERFSAEFDMPSLCVVAAGDRLG